jgi:hypothetical protein
MEQPVLLDPKGFRATQVLLAHKGFRAIQDLPDQLELLVLLDLKAMVVKLEQPDLQD